MFPISSDHVIFWTYIFKEMFEDTKGVIRSRKSKERQYNGQKKKDKRTKNNIQNTTQKTKDRATLTPQKTRVNSCTPDR